MPTGFTDIWKGNYDGKPVCIKAIRTKDLNRLREIQGVRDSLVASTAYSAHFIPDLPLVQAHFPSEFTPRYPDFRDAVSVSGAPISVLLHEPVDARWERHTVHPDEPKCEPANAGTFPSTRDQLQPTDYSHNSLRRCAGASCTFTGCVFYTVTSFQ
jgi:hypothetical protein